MSIHPKTTTTCVFTLVLMSLFSHLATAEYKVVNTCTGTYPSYWQDVNPKFSDMWQGQQVSNAPTKGWQNPIFQLSDKYPRAAFDDKKNQKWRLSKFDKLFRGDTTAKDKKKLAEKYAWLVFNYILEGNINQPEQMDFDVCKNPVRPWFHIPFQTYNAMSGREFTHGLTREAPVTFSVKDGTGLSVSTMWALGIFNQTAAYTLGKVWKKNGKAKIPKTDIKFLEGAVVGKPLFNTSTEAQMPMLKNMPSWKANISDPAFCHCKPSTGTECTLIEESQQCPRSHVQWNDVKLLQFDIAIKDSRAKGTGWVFGTFVADGESKVNEPEPWKRVSLLGLMWGNDTPPKGKLAYNYPENPRKNGFAEEVIIWDTVDRLNKVAGAGVMRRPGHLGCNHRLNGPADNANSSCMSCHGTASVPDINQVTPPLLSQFSALTKECVAPIVGQNDKGMDRSGDSATVNNKVSFTDIDSIYFANVPASTPFNMSVNGVNIMGEGVPTYPDKKRKKWISLDYSLQLSISIKQWMEWQKHKETGATSRIVDKELQRHR